MPTVQQVVDRVKLSGDIPDSIKYRWLSELDKVKYIYPKDKDTLLSIPEPDDSLYDKYLIAMNDFFTCNMAAYNASAITFEIAYNRYKDKKFKVSNNRR